MLFFIVIQAFMTYNKLTLPIKDDTKNKNHELVQIIKNEYHIIQPPFGKYDIKEKLAAPSNMIEISNRPWLIITHIFTHIEYMHFIVNMFFLYFFGKITSIFMNKKITTLYVGGGLSGYLFFVLASNIFPGTRVKQGEVIGYVGSTGRSTGPHLHYEILVNNRQVNPMTVRLPTGEKIDQAHIEDFKNQVNVVEAEIIARGTLRFATALPSVTKP